MQPGGGKYTRDRTTHAGRIIDLLKSQPQARARVEKAEEHRNVTLARYMEQQYQDKLQQGQRRAAGSGQRGGELVALARPFDGHDDSMEGVPQAGPQENQPLTRSCAGTSDGVGP